MGTAETLKTSDRILRHPLLRKYTAVIRQDLSATYSRDIHKWLIVAPIIGVVTGLVVTGITYVILDSVWAFLLPTYIRHHAYIIPGLLVGFVLTGIIMQRFTHDPDEHSTEEIIRSYHEHQGDIDMRGFVPKLLAAITTVGFGGSAALEGPSIYGGGAIGSWLWGKLRRVGLEPRDRRIMLISGAAAGMAAVFRAPLTGLVFALEMPYKDDLAHEALLPSLIASVVSYVTMASILGSKPLFDFIEGKSFTRMDLVYAAVLGVIIGLIAVVFNNTFRRFRTFAVRAPIPHWLKLTIGGLLTGVCGLAFVSAFNGPLIPIGPNYEAVRDVLMNPHSSGELVLFGVLKLAATVFSLGTGGVSAMFVPLFLTGGAFGTAFGQSIIHSPSAGLYAAVGMAAFIAAGYKTPLTAVVFVAEATGGHAYLIPALVGAAVAYGISGEASVSGDQHLHESVKLHELSRIPAREIMQKQVTSVEATSTLRHFAESLGVHERHAAYPVYDEGKPIGTVSMWSLGKVPPEQWSRTIIREVMDHDAVWISDDTDVMEALRLLRNQRGLHLLLVRSRDKKLDGIVTKTDILSALDSRGLGAPPEAAPAAAESGESA